MTAGRKGGYRQFVPFAFDNFHNGITSAPLWADKAGPPCEGAMQHTPPGNSQTKTDTVKRAMEILKDRPMPQPKPYPRDILNGQTQRQPEKAANLRPPSKA
jgi:hypothetical protein